MSFNYDSQTWVVNSAINHATDILTGINTNLTSLGYSSSDLLKPSANNAVWIQLLAQGAIRADYDNVLYDAQISLDPAQCSDAQVLNLATIAGTELQQGTYSTVVITVTASSAGSAVIPSGSQLPFTNGIYFSTQQDNTILANASASITVIASIRGAILVLANQLTSFSPTIANVASITSAQSVEGVFDETIPQLRERIIIGSTFKNNLDGLQRNLEQLEGVTSAKCYFNPDSVSDLTLPGSITVLPRNLQVYIQGTSLLVGKTIFETLMLKTQGSESQIYTTLSGQSFTVYYDYSTNTTVYVKILVPDASTLADSVILAITNLVLTLSPTIGQAIDSNMVDELFIGFTGCEIVGCLISTDNINFYQRVVINGNSVAKFTAANISVVTFS